MPQAKELLAKAESSRGCESKRRRGLFVHVDDVNLYQPQVQSDSQKGYLSFDTTTRGDNTGTSQFQKNGWVASTEYSTNFLFFGCYVSARQSKLIHNML
jgi:hypothetical protein